MNTIDDAIRELNAGRFAEAIALAETVVASTGDTNELTAALVIKASGHLGRNQAENAVAPMIEACRLGSAQARILAIEWCQRERMLGEWGRAIELARRVFDADRTNHRIARELIDLFLACGNDLEAEEIFNQRHRMSAVIEAKYARVFNQRKNIISTDPTEFEVTAITAGALAGRPTLVSSHWPNAEIESRVSGKKCDEVTWFFEKVVSAEIKTVISLGSDWIFYELLLVTVNNSMNWYFYETNNTKTNLIIEVSQSLGFERNVTILDNISQSTLRRISTTDGLCFINTDQISEEVCRFLLENDVLKGYLLIYGQNTLSMIPKNNRLYSWWSHETFGDARTKNIHWVVGMPSHSHGS